MAYWRVGEFPSLASYLRGHHDDSAPGAVKHRNTSRDSRYDASSKLLGHRPKLRGLHEEEVYITWVATAFWLDSLA